MNHVGRTVVQKYGSILRFGIVMAQEERNSWRHLRIKWVNDKNCEKATSRRNELTNKNHNRVWYRIDDVLFIDPDETISTLHKIENYLYR